MNEELIKYDLFHKGLNHYKNRSFLNAHEDWETLWSDYYLPDRDFIQGLIQFSVSFIHLNNGNLIGAKSLLKKCQKKFNNFNGDCRGINVDILKNDLQQLSIEYDLLETHTSFNWEFVPELRT